MDTLLQDVRYAVRQLIKRPTTTLVVVFTLALGIGANTSMFTLLDAALLRPLPGADADRLVWVTAVEGRARNPLNMSYPDYRDVRDRVRSFSGVLAYTHTALSLGGAQPERVRAELVTGNYFGVLGIPVSHGRAFRADDDGAPGAHAVAVVSDAFWRARLAASAGALDSTITINGHPFTVIGVAAPGFTGVELSDEQSPALWLPMAMIGTAEPGSGLLTDRNSFGAVRVIGRLAPGASLAKANAELAVLGPTLRVNPSPVAENLSLAAFSATGGTDPSNRSEILPALSLLMIVPLLVLVVACANSANVLLARGLARRTEIAVRRALGGTRARLVRQLLTESVLLALAAGVVGVLLSFWLTSAIGHFGDLPPAILAVLTPDRRVLVATTLLAAATGIVFGLAPALAATRPSLTPALKSAGVTMEVGRSRHRLRDLLVVSQVGVSVVLLVTAALFGRSLSKVVSVDPGYGARQGVYVGFDLARQGYASDKQESFERNLLDAVRALPGVQAAALASTVPFGGSYMEAQVRPEGAAENAAAGPWSFSASVSPDYFEALQVPIVRGRGFTPRDGADAPLVVVLNATLARRVWPDADPIGRRVRLSGANEPLREVVGIAGDGKYANLVESPRGFVYLPQAQRPAASLVLVARMSSDPAAAFAPIRRAMRSLDPDLPLYNERTFAEALHGAADTQQAAASMLGVFGSLALLLAALGIYGVTAHGVAMRTREIGIRMSLGARSANVLSLFVREGVALALVGVVTGLVISAALSRLIAAYLFGLAPTDGLTFGLAAVVLCTVAALASYVPARRATRVDPMVALRYE